MDPAKIEEEIILNLLKSVLTEKYRGGGGGGGGGGEGL